MERDLSQAGAREGAWYRSFFGPIDGATGQKGVSTVAKSRVGQALAALRREEGFLQDQLGKVRDAIAALGGVGKEYARLQGARKKRSRKGTPMSDAQKKAVSARMKKYWAERRKGN